MGKVFWWIFAFILFFWLGYLSGKLDTTSDVVDYLQRCAKQHNVYKCELVAQPVKGGVMSITERSEEGPKCPWCGCQYTADESYYYDQMGYTRDECMDCNKQFSVSVETTTVWETKRMGNQ